jgi:hypothetical protein
VIWARCRTKFVEKSGEEYLGFASTWEWLWDPSRGSEGPWVTTRWIFDCLWEGRGAEAPFLSFSGQEELAVRWENMAEFQKNTLTGTWKWGTREGWKQV